MKKILMAAMLAVSSQSVAADWELLPDTKYCIVRNGIDWGNDVIGETRFGWYGDKIYLSAINPEWDIKTSKTNPFESEADADFDGVRVPAMVYSSESRTLIVEIDGTDLNLQRVLRSNAMRVYPKGSKEMVFGFELDEMIQAAELVALCYGEIKA
jgi:opacity protein-like surface antigen